MAFTYIMANVYRVTIALIPIAMSPMEHVCPAVIMAGTLIQKEVNVPVFVESNVSIGTAVKQMVHV